MSRVHWKGLFNQADLSTADCPNINTTISSSLDEAVAAVSDPYASYLAAFVVPAGHAVQIRVTPRKAIDVLVVLT